jgi:hypothetical protein
MTLTAPGRILSLEFPNPLPRAAGTLCPAPGWRGISPSDALVGGCCRLRPRGITDRRTMLCQPSEELAAPNTGTIRHRNANRHRFPSTIIRPRDCGESQRGKLKPAEPSTLAKASGSGLVNDAAATPRQNSLSHPMPGHCNQSPQHSCHPQRHSGAYSVANARLRPKWFMSSASAIRWTPNMNRRT